MLRLDLCFGAGGMAPMDDSGRSAMRNACNRGVSGANEGAPGGHQRRPRQHETALWVAPSDLFPRVGLCPLRVLASLRITSSTGPGTETGRGPIRGPDERLILKDCTEYCTRAARGGARALPGLDGGLPASVPRTGRRRLDDGPGRIPSLHLCRAGQRHSRPCGGPAHRSGVRARGGGIGGGPVRRTVIAPCVREGVAAWSNRARRREGRRGTPEAPNDPTPDGFPPPIGVEGKLSRE